MAAVAKEKHLKDWRVQEGIFVTIIHTCVVLWSGKASVRGWHSSKGLKKERGLAM